MLTTTLELAAAASFIGGVVLAVILVAGTLAGVAAGLVLVAPVLLLIALAA